MPKLRPQATKNPNKYSEPYFIPSLTYSVAMQQTQLQILQFFLSSQANQATPTPNGETAI